MQEKKNGTLLAVVIVLGIAVVLTIGLVIVAKLQAGVPSLKPMVEEKEKKSRAAIEEAVPSYEKKHNGFSTGSVSVTRMGEMPADTEEMEEEEEETSEYICSFSSDRRLTEADLVDIYSNIDISTIPDDKTVAQMIINEMYARHGYVFSKQAVQAYFDEKQWYADINDRNDDMEEIYTNMSKIEKENIAFLEDYR